jgi:hypothetical protein
MSDSADTRRSSLVTGHSSSESWWITAFFALFWAIILGSIGGVVGALSPVLPKRPDDLRPPGQGAGPGLGAMAALFLGFLVGMTAGGLLGLVLRVARARRLLRLITAVGLLVVLGEFGWAAYVTHAAASRVFPAELWIYPNPPADATEQVYFTYSENGIRRTNAYTKLQPLGQPGSFPLGFMNRELSATITWPAPRQFEIRLDFSPERQVPLKVNVGGGWQTIAGPWQDVYALLDRKPTSLPVELSPIEHHLLIKGRWLATPDGNTGR